jgi:LPS-assembly protein
MLKYAKQTIKTTLGKIIYFTLILFFIPAYVSAASLGAVEGIKQSSRYELCGSNIRVPDIRLLKQNLKSPENIHIQAESAQMNQSATSIFTGNVEALHNGNLLRADKLQYNNTNDYLLANGNVYFSNEAIEINGEKIDYNTQTEQGEIRKANYYLFSNGARGSTPSLQIKSRTKVKFIETSYTTCPENNTAWNIKASVVELDTENHQGTAENAVLSFHKVPIFYFPYFRFPIGIDRLSGFMAPTWGTSNKHGNEYRLPFYWNIAPNYDATITPRHMTKRGTLIDSEFRYLTQNNNGVFDVGFIQNDAKFNDDREYYAYKNFYSNGQHWTSTVDLTYYSDTSYLADFSSILEESSISHVEESADLTYTGSDWLFKTKLQGYQTLSGDDPYTRLPQILFDYKGVALDNQLNYFFRSEFVYFEHSSTEPRNGRDTTPTGFRSDIEPAISYPMVSPAAYLKPKLSFRLTQYNLQNPGTDLTDPSIEYKKDPNRAVPTFSLDSGVFFERDTAFVDIPILNTLEPRIFYLYRPERDQSQLPNFDTTTVDSSFNQLFRENTNTGADFVPAANELSLGLSSHFYRLDSGVSMLSASIGQKRFFQIKDNPASTLNYFVDIKAQPSEDWSLGSTLEYNKETKDLDKSTSRLQYKAYRNGVVNFLHRYERNLTESLDISFQWKITSQWQGFGRRNYDSFNSKLVEQVYGLRYDSCCWAFRIVKRETVLDNERSLFFEFILKGLSSIGDRSHIDPLINNAIIDFSN